MPDMPVKDHEAWQHDTKPGVDLRSLSLAWEEGKWPDVIQDDNRCCDGSSADRFDEGVHSKMVIPNNTLVTFEGPYREQLFFNSQSHMDDFDQEASPTDLEVCTGRPNWMS